MKKILIVNTKTSFINYTVGKTYKFIGNLSLSDVIYFKKNNTYSTWQFYTGFEIYDTVDHLNIHEYIKEKSNYDIYEINVIGNIISDLKYITDEFSIIRKLEPSEYNQYSSNNTTFDIDGNITSYHNCITKNEDEIIYCDYDKEDKLICKCYKDDANNIKLNIKYSYNESGNIIKEDYGDYFITYEYDYNKNLICKRTSDDDESDINYLYLYDENNNIISYRNNNDDWVKFEYNSENQQTKFENNFGYFEKYTYENNNIVQIKNSNGKIYKYIYDADNNLIGYNTDKLSFSIEIK